MKQTSFITGGCLILLAFLIGIVQPTCVLESDFGFKINCAFKKAGLFRVRNLGGFKAHASLGFSLGDELGFEQSLTNQDPSRRRSTNLKNGAPPNLIADSSIRPNVKQEKRGKQNRIMMRPMAPATRPNQSTMDKLTSLHRRVSSTMQPIIVSPPEPTLARVNPTVTMAKPMPMGVPAFKPLPPKEDTLKVLPIQSTRKSFTPLQIPQTNGPVVYQSENYPHASHDQVSKMVSQLTHSYNTAPQFLRITPAPIIITTPKFYPIPTKVNPFVPMPLAAPPTQSLTFTPVFKTIQIHPSNPHMQTAMQNTNPISNFVDPVPHQVHDLVQYQYNTKKADDYNTISGYGDDTTLKFSKEDINEKIAEIAKAGNISMEAVEAAIALRQQQLLSKYANLPVPTSTTTTSTTTTTEEPLVFQPEPEPEINIADIPDKPKRYRNPTSGKVMNAPKEYYPVGYEKDFDDHFQSKVDLPDTNFHCGDQKYFPGLYGDESLGCMVFHVCALTDDGLVMKSFLCPESTLFDQTILKCNWWFYVDCKSTRRLYDTNIPVSKSYQLMKALTFFSSYKKEMQDSAKPSNPEDIAGVKEAISILQNHDSKSQNPMVQIVTPVPHVDERNNHKAYNETSPVYRNTRTYNNTTNRNNGRRNIKPKTETQSDPKLVNVKADFNVKESSSEETKTTSSEIKNGTDNTPEKKYRRRLALKNSQTPTGFTASTPKPTTTTTAKLEETTATYVELVQEPQTSESKVIVDVKQETLHDQIYSETNTSKQALQEVKRVYRSSAETQSNDEKEMTIVNNEKIQIIRPTPMARLVGEFATPVAAIAKLDEAVLGTNIRNKKSAILIVTPEKHEHYKTKRSPTDRERT